MGVNIDTTDAGQARVQAFRPGAFFPDHDEPMGNWTILFSNLDGDAGGLTGTPDELNEAYHRFGQALAAIKAKAREDASAADDDEENYSVNIDGNGQGDAFIGAF